MLTFTLIAINIAAFFLEQRDQNLFMGLFALWPPSPAVAADEPIFHVWQLLTYSALHANLTHFLFNMFGLYIFLPARTAIRRSAHRPACSGFW